jgi:hypothetical protein
MLWFVAAYYLFGAFAFFGFFFLVWWMLSLLRETGDRDYFVAAEPREVTRIVGRKSIKIPVERHEKGLQRLANRGDWPPPIGERTVLLMEQEMAEARKAERVRVAADAIMHEVEETVNQEDLEEELERRFAALAKKQQ